MNTPISSIHIYDIAEVNSGQILSPNELFVYTDEEIPVSEKMFHPVRADHFAMYLNLGESIDIEYNLICYTMIKNSFFVIVPGIVHVFKSASYLATINMEFTQEFLASSMVHKKHPEALGFLSQKSVPLLQLNDEEVQTLYRMMFFLKEMNRNNRHPFKEDMIHHGFNLFMLEAASIAKKYRGHEEHGLTRKENILMNFLKQLTDHFNEERSVQFYANALFISHRHLTKTVKELTTKTCSELIDEMVITEAKILLGDMSYSIGQVADLLHFSDQFIFSKFFKNRTSLSPKEYKYYTANRLKL